MVLDVKVNKKLLQSQEVQQSQIVAYRQHRAEQHFKKWRMKQMKNKAANSLFSSEVIRVRERKITMLEQIY